MYPIFHVPFDDKKNLYNPGLIVLFGYWVYIYKTNLETEGLEGIVSISFHLCLALKV